MDCIFCKIVNGDIPSKVIYEDELVLALMDISPICDGHVLVIPKKHYVTVFDLDKEMLHHMYEVAYKVNNWIMKALNKKGATFLFNYGDKQEIKHVHLHIMPEVRKAPTKKVEEVYNLIMSVKNEEEEKTIEA